MWKTKSFKQKKFYIVYSGKGRTGASLTTGQTRFGCFDFGRSGDGIVAEISLHNTGTTIVSSRCGRLNYPNETYGFEVSIGRFERWLRFGMYSLSQGFQIVWVRLSMNVKLSMIYFEMKVSNNIEQAVWDYCVQCCRIGTSECNWTSI